MAILPREPEASRIAGNDNIASHDRRQKRVSLIKLRLPGAAVPFRRCYAVSPARSGFPHVNAKSGQPPLLIGDGWTPRHVENVAPCRHFVAALSCVSLHYGVA